MNRLLERMPAASDPAYPVRVNGRWTEWRISLYLTDRWGDVNAAASRVLATGNPEADDPAAQLAANPPLLARLREQMFDEATFVARKDGRFGVLFEIERACREVESEHDPAGAEGYLPAADVVAALEAAASRIAARFAGVELAVPEHRLLTPAVPTIWAFVPDGVLPAPAQREALWLALEHA